MKLDSTLPERPGFLHAVPVLDLFGLLLVMLMMGPAFVAHSGVSVELPPSRFQLDRYVRPLVITVGPGQPPVLFVGQERVELDRLGRRLEAIRSDMTEVSERVAVLKVDSSVPVNIERQVAELALQRGFRVMLAGRYAPGGVQARPRRARGDGQQ